MLRDTPVEVIESWPHSASDDERAFGVWAVYAGRCQTKANYTVGPRVRPYYSLHLVLAGRALFRNERMSADADLEAGDLFCIFPNLVSQQRAVAAHPPRLAWLAFDGPAALPITARLGVSPEHPVRRGLDLDRLQPLVRQMGTVFSDLAADHLLYPTEYLVRFLGQALSTAFPASAAARRPWLHAARALLDEHCAESITIAEVASQVGVDRSHLWKEFTAEFGLSPSAYLQNARLAQARRLLAETDLSISQVALSVGYADVYAFSHAFRRGAGVSPSQARRAHAGNGGAPTGEEG